MLLGAVAGMTLLAIGTSGAAPAVAGVNAVSAGDAPAPGQGVMNGADGLRHPHGSYPRTHAWD
ncbi:hypothetical protein ACH4E7_37430 [Kitasatospora sp. NPDC018058]|uniref:hypothetical protein n=1 Tax=Kitasatospora sp. NPDC018058 TaxID=3364025 RepID=UPI0037BF3868